jgi:hypothetical protein
VQQRIQLGLQRRDALPAFAREAQHLGLRRLAGGNEATDGVREVGDGQARKGVLRLASRHLSLSWRVAIGHSGGICTSENGDTASGPPPAASPFLCHR